MKLFTTTAFLCLFLNLNAQITEKTKGFYYKAALATTLTINQDYTIGDQDSGTFLIPNAMIVNSSVGYQFDRRSNLGVGVEYDHYLDQRLNFLPVFIEFTYNIWDFDDQFFIRGGYGKLVDLGKTFESGTTYKAGIGLRLYDQNFRNSFLVGLDFSRKRFGFRQTEKLTSVSIFIEFMLF